MTGTRALGRPTLDQVAARAGVGRGTASRVVNGSPQVTHATRAAVLQAIEELGYVPNRAARSLVTRRTDSVALVISESEDRLFGEPYFASVLRGISEVLLESSLQLLLTMVRSQAERRRTATYLTSQHVDGVLLLSLHGDDPLPFELESRGVPAVCGGRPLETAPSCYVDVDNRDGGRQAVEHLVARQRQRIALITGPQDMHSGRERLAGAREALAGAGLPDDPRLWVEGDYSERSGERAMRELVSRGVGFDGLFAGSDLMAVGALRVLRERGLATPRDVAVVGFDDSPVCRHTDPQLTTVHQPVEEMGRRMTRTLLARIEGKPWSAATILPTRLVVRGST